MLRQFLTVSQTLGLLYLLFNNDAAIIKKSYWNLCVSSFIRSISWLNKDTTRDARGTGRPIRISFRTHFV
jgi:hypothetical protein